jgi:hypothetical protein
MRLNTLPTSTLNSAVTLTERNSVAQQVQSYQMTNSPISVKQAPKFSGWFDVFKPDQWTMADFTRSLGLILIGSLLGKGCVNHNAASSIQADRAVYVDPASEQTLRFLESEGTSSYFWDLAGEDLYSVYAPIQSQLEEHAKDSYIDFDTQRDKIVMEKMYGNYVNLYRKAYPGQPLMSLDEFSSGINQAAITQFIEENPHDMEIVPDSNGAADQE